MKTSDHTTQERRQRSGNRQLSQAVTIQKVAEHKSLLVRGFISCMIALFLLGMGLFVPIGGDGGGEAVYAQSIARTHECENLLVNGDAEAGNGWAIGNTPFPASYVTSPVHDGARSLRLGVPSGYNNTFAYSSVFQEITIPSDATRVLFNYWELVSGGSDGYDYREIALFSENFLLLDTLKHERGAGNNVWTQSHWFDLTKYKGQTIVLYINVYNNGFGSRMWTYLDNISLIYCPEHEGAHTTSSPTQTPTQTPTKTPAPTMTPTSTPYLTPTWTPQPASTPTPTATPIIAMTPTPIPPTPTWTPAPSTDNGPALVRIGNSSSSTNSISVPLEVVNIPQGRTVGALSVHVRYDTSRLQATHCNVNGNLTVLCNIERPGRIQLSAISANGISANFTLATLTVNILTVDGIPSVLDVDVMSFVDTESNDIPATEQNGEITTSSTCVLGDVNCDNQVDVSDALLILQYDAGMRQSSDSYPLPANTLYRPACDINNDSHCNVVDSLTVLQCSVGINHGFCGNRSAARSIGDQPARPMRRGAGDTRLYVDAPDITERKDDTLLKRAKSVIVPVKINTTDNLGAISMKVSYDPTLLQLTECVTDPEERFDISLCHIGGELGEVQFNVVSMMGISGVGLPLAELHFESLGKGGDGSKVDVEVITATDAEGAILPISTQSREISADMTEDSVPIVNR